MSGGQILRAVGDGDDPGAYPAGASRVVGAHLRQLRKDKQLRLIDVVRSGVVGSAATLSRIENGTTPLKANTVLGLAKYYGVTSEAELNSLVTLIERARQTLWWEEFRDVVPGWLERLISVETAAREIRTYEVQYVPGLLQTAEYTRALTRLAFPDLSADDAEKQSERRERTVAVRQRRRALLHAAEPPHFYALVDEAVLARPVGGPAVMRQQLRELYSLEENVEHIRIRVLPFSAGDAVMAPAPSITFLAFPPDGGEDMVYLEVRNGGSYLTHTTEVERHRLVLTSLWAQAATREETLDLLQHYIDQLAD
ncbi:helix-turn-helix domain-containing protein [Streptomyces sp. NPDC002643]